MIAPAPTSPTVVYRVHLRPVPVGVDALGREPSVRLRGLLKLALRGFGLVCDHIDSDPQTDTTGAEPAKGPTS